MKHVVGIAEMKVSNCSSAELVTYSLGSCLGVSFYDRVGKIGGLIHCMLPLSKIDPKKAQLKPCMFIDTGITHILKKMFALGATRKNLVIKVAGGASVLDEGGRFRIGERNFTVLRKILWKNDLLIRSDDVGGTIARTMTLRMDSGETFVKIKGTEVVL